MRITYSQYWGEISLQNLFLMFSKTQKWRKWAKSQYLDKICPWAKNVHHDRDVYHTRSRRPATNATATTMLPHVCEERSHAQLFYCDLQNSSMRSRDLAPQSRFTAMHQQITISTWSKILRNHPKTHIAPVPHPIILTSLWRYKLLQRLKILKITSKPRIKHQIKISTFLS